MHLQYTRILPSEKKSKIKCERTFGVNLLNLKKKKLSPPSQFAEEKKNLLNYLFYNS